MPRSEKIIKYLKGVICLALAGLLFLTFSQTIELTASDLGRHLANGRTVFIDHQVLFKNLYSYTEPEQPFINHHWLSGVIYQGVYLLGGFKALSFFNLLLIAVIFFLVFHLAVRKSNFYLAAALAIPAIFLLGERVEVRPEIFSYLFIVLIWWQLERAERSKEGKIKWWLIPLFFLWANIHIYFFIGLSLIGFKAAADFLTVSWSLRGDFRTRLETAWQASHFWFLNLGLAIFASLLTPNFIKGLLYPFNIFRNYGYQIAENKSIFYLENLVLNDNFGLFKVWLLLLVISFGGHWIFVSRRRLFDLFIVLFFSALALFASRNLALFALFAFVITAASLKPFLDFWRDRLFCRVSPLAVRQVFLVVILILISGSFLFLFSQSERAYRTLKTGRGLGLSEGSEEVVNFWRANNLSGPIFNNYDLGGALIFWLYPQEKVFVDNRPEAYQSKFFKETYLPYQEDPAAFKMGTEKYGFRTVLFSHTDSTPWAQSFLSNLVTNSDWVLVYFDRYSVIFLNKNAYPPEKIEALGLSQASLREKLRSLAENSTLKNKLHLASLATTLRQPDLAAEIYQEILFAQPDNINALASRGLLLASSPEYNQRLRARDYLELAIKKGYHLPAAYNQLGLINWSLGNYSLATENWRSALKRERKNTTALYYLSQAENLK